MNRAYTAELRASNLINSCNFFSDSIIKSIKSAAMYEVKFWFEANLTWLYLYFFCRKEHWDEVVKHYYDVFNRTLAEFGLVLRHLGTTFNDFLYEVKRALRGQFLCVAFIIPIGKTNLLKNK